MSKKRIFFIETLLTHGQGHHLDNLIESTLFFKDNYKFDIKWLLNESFEKKNLYIPEETKIYNLFNNIRQNHLILLTKKIIYFLKYILFFIRQKRFYDFLNAIIKNYFSIPVFFNLKVYNFFINNNLNDEDIIIIQSCRPKEVELINFLSFFISVRPKIILRILYPPKKSGLKNFYFYVDELKKKGFDIKIFTEVETIKKYIMERSNYNIENFTQIYDFYKRYNNSNFTIGFLGESRIDKGFNKLPDLIRLASKKIQNINIIIQFSEKIYPKTDKCKKDIIELSKINKNIKIVYGYLDYFKYRELLKEINIMPILYEGDKLNFVGSGLFYSCITHEIPIIIPKSASLIKNDLKYNSFLEANTIEEYVDSVDKISKNYDFYLNECKKLSKYYKERIYSDPLVKNVIN